MQRNYTAEDVKAYRDKHSCGLLEAKAGAEREHFLSLLEYARTSRDFDVLCYIVEQIVKKDARS